jgi:hypothetical protein
MRRSPDLFPPRPTLTPTTPSPPSARPRCSSSFGGQSESSKWVSSSSALSSTSNRALWPEINASTASGMDMATSESRNHKSVDRIALPPSRHQSSDQRDSMPPAESSSRTGPRPRNREPPPFPQPGSVHPAAKRRRLEASERGSSSRALAASRPDPKGPKDSDTQLPVVSRLPRYRATVG